MFSIEVYLGKDLKRTSVCDTQTSQHMCILLMSKNFAYQYISYCSLTIGTEPDVPDVRFVTVMKIEN